MKKITLEKIINLIFFMYILSIYLFTYREGLFIISNMIAFIFVFLVAIKVLISKDKIIINSYLIYHIIFILISGVSFFYAINKNNVITELRTLILTFIVMIAIVNYVDTPKKLDLAIKSFIVAGLLSSIYIIIVSDFSNITRYGRELGNQNAIGMIIGISSIFSLNEYYRFKKKKNLAFLIPMIIVILLTGSRKSLLFVVLGMILTIYFKNKKSMSQRIKSLIIIIMISVLSLYMIFEVPVFYQIIGKRVESMMALSTGVGKVDNSMNERLYMIDYGISLFKNKPFLGYGSDNYRIMFLKMSGFEKYSHNNFIELLVNVGIIGASVYYLTNFKVIKSLSKISSKANKKELIHPFIIIIIAYFVLGTSLVYYDSKHFSFLLALASVTPRIDYDNIEKEINI